MIFQDMPYAVLRVSTRIERLTSDGSIWVSEIKNPDKRTPYDLVYHEVISNPERPSFEVVRHMYTHSEFSFTLDQAIVSRLKRIRIEQNNYDKKMKSEDLDSELDKIFSINQIWLTSPYSKYLSGPLDDLWISLPTMLDWLEELGWIVEKTTREYNTCEILLHTKY